MIDLIKRQELIPVEKLEIADAGFANGISTYLKNLILSGDCRSLNNQEKESIIKAAAEAYGLFLSALGVEWENDPNSAETPLRVAKSYVNDLWKGRYELLDPVTSFPSDNYTGLVFEGNIPIISMCSHHHREIKGKAYIAYIPTLEGRVIGLSKLNRIVEYFSRRGAIQEQLTSAIHNAVDVVCKNNQGVAVMIKASHSCVSCRGVRHEGAAMITSKLSKSFLEEDACRKEFYDFIKTIN